ncbi:MAG: multidrug ABC transporter ATP-binding protein, partial [Pseudonocardiales bacterium]
MSAPRNAAVPERLPEAGTAARRGGGPPWMGAAMPAEKSMTFGPSAGRLLARLRPERTLVLCVLGLAVISVTLAVLGPKILGHATNIIFAGVIGKRLPPDLTRQQAVDAARARGEGKFADLITGMHVTPGAGIDFAALGNVLLLALAIYVGANVLSWLQGYLLNG